MLGEEGLVERRAAAAEGQLRPASNATSDAASGAAARGLGAHHPSVGEQRVAAHLEASDARGELVAPAGEARPDEEVQDGLARHLVRECLGSHRECLGSVEEGQDGLARHLFTAVAGLGGVNRRRWARGHTEVRLPLAARVHAERAAPSERLANHVEVVDPLRQRHETGILLRRPREQHRLEGGGGNSLLLRRSQAPSLATALGAAPAAGRLGVAVSALVVVVVSARAVRAVG